ncbi:hypothetical protein [Cupriavidus sp. USMAHM13]|uniref:hypothetical protein n=1 Tax=Cupriavidus sp. USMAHM13 TaxID=1389192 RepID=UPI0009F58CA4|nr:hypothetical protein [Cupriavidus sp. USMAHM13]
MKANTTRRVRKNAQFESPEAIRARLAAFALVTRAKATRRSNVEEPTVRGSVLAGRRIRVAG